MSDEQIRKEAVRRLLAPIDGEMGRELDLGVGLNHWGELARNQFTPFFESFDAELAATVRRIFPDPVAAAIKYGEHKWGAFA